MELVRNTEPSGDAITAAHTKDCMEGNQYTVHISAAYYCDSTLKEGPVMNLCSKAAIQNNFVACSRLLQGCYKVLAALLLPCSVLQTIHSSCSQAVTMM